jgi:glycosyl transferase family 2
VRVWRGRRNFDQPSVLWNFLFDRAYGRYFTVLDDDNEKLPTFVARMSQVLDEEPGIGVVTCGWRVQDERRRRSDDYFLNLSTNAERLANLSTCDGGAMLYRREVFERAGYFSEVLRTNEDWDWLRRAMSVGGIKNLHEVHATYRAHDASRMKRCKDLGSDGDAERVRQRPLLSDCLVWPTFPPHERLTASQRDVCASIERGLQSISWVHSGRKAYDISIVVSPFQMSSEECARAVVGSARALSLHMEDPYALEANLDRVRAMQRVVETWVCTNDAATVPYYQAIVGDRVLCCPSLSWDSELQIEGGDSRRDIDVLLCGYAYPSRKRFVEELSRYMNGFNFVLVGDGWSQPGARSTQPLSETYRLHERARAIVCLQRVHGDCSDGPVEPATLNRGFMEGAHGARVFVDRSRPRHALEPADVVFYDSPKNLAAQLKAYLHAPVGRAAEVFATKCRLLYSYRTRLARAINCVRAPRYLAEIP